MADIKTKDTVRDIKAFDKSSVLQDSLKRASVRVKDTAENLSDDGYVSPSEYAEDNIKNMASDTVDDVTHAAKKGTNKAVEKGRDAFRRHQENKAEEAVKDRFDDIKRTTRSRRAVRGKDRTIKAAQKTERSIKQTAKATGKSSVKTAEKTVKGAEKTVKTAEKTSRVAIKTAEASAKAAEKAAQTAAKAAQKAAELARQAAIAAYKAAVAAAKAIAAAIKAIVTGFAKIVASIAALGSLALVVVVIICLVALLVFSIFGIFFSSEDTGSDETMQEVVQEINTEYQDKIDEIKDENAYDYLELSGARAIWPDVLSVYAVKTTNDKDDPQEIVTIDENKKQILKDIFWDMNDISYTLETKTVDKTTESDDGNGNILEETTTETKTYLYITVSHKTADEMATEYGFDSEQMSQLQELLAQGNETWSAVLNGIYGTDDQIVAIARSQIGNTGGEPYWSWYGFNSRVEWCACFVSWCANQCGYIDIGVIPKFASCEIGTEWFKEREQWADNSNVPTPGTIIFFDWDNKGESGAQDGTADHVGIVEKVEDDYVYTIEGNSNDSCERQKYSIGNYEILGYGLVLY